jgi:hypothetical protein
MAKATMMPRLRSNTLTKVCETHGPVEFQTPQGGTLAYGSCRRHGWFMAMMHCPVSDIRSFAESLLEAADVAEAKSGQHGKPSATKGAPK